MKELRLSRLLLENFKGIDRLEVRLDGCNATISGQNGTGKTTVADAYTWLLTGKMADGRTAEIGYFDSTGRLDTAANHVVEAEFTDGTSFRRETNGTTKFYANGIPVKKKDYDSAVEAATRSAVPCLIMPQNFCAMNWADRRRILMSLAAITDDEIIASTPELEPLKLMLRFSTADELTKRAKDKKKKLNVELTSIPARISELSRTERPAKDAADIQAEIDALQKQLEEKTAEVRNLQAIGKKTLEPLNEINRLRQEAGAYDRAAAEADKEIVRIEGELANLRKEIKDLHEKLEDLRAEWVNVNDAAGGKCPTCGAKIGGERLPEFHERLDQIKAKGAKAKATIQKYEEAIPRGEEKLQTCKRAKLTAEREAMARRDKAAELQAKFEADTASDIADANLNKAIEERDKIQSAINGRENALVEIERYGKIAARIEELRRQEKEIGGQIAELERQIYLAELFTSKKIELTEDAINSKFAVVRWKMFKELKSTDGLEECCEPMINGVPYGGNLSKGERLKAALDILGTLQKFYGVELPVFIDDAESYTNNSRMNLPNQVIYLRAAEGVLKLKIDVQEPETRQMSLFEEAAE